MAITTKSTSVLPGAVMNDGKWSGVSGGSAKAITDQAAGRATGILPAPCICVAKGDSAS